MQVNTSFDTQKVTLFPPGVNSITLGNFVITHTGTSTHWSVREYFDIKVKQQDGSWTTPLPLAVYHFCEWYLEKDNFSRDRKFTLQTQLELLDEIKKRMFFLKREHSKKVAKERDQRNKAEAAALGITVEELIFERKKVITTNVVEKKSKKYLKQVELSMKYSEYLDELEREIARCRKVLNCGEVNRLHLRNTPFNLQRAINTFKCTLRTHIDLLPEEEENQDKKKG